ncbi:NusG domain II-containing protein [Clostridium sp. 'White wine YQ']|uniref:NusG domain II-containing protein n=1 Tax=Clostridium sp. 'White wine YQ' TaxID=3027474 RepID=UPI002365882F|nr:NusG domain II-containing protein [Clostridium sp. 'White wine YQ']MDD7792657.1 NusG domain II-containing protein [Clostridium sp. 'White wine YQ']
MIKKWDIIIIILLVTLSFLPELILGVALKKDYKETYAQITIEGKVYKNIPLSTHKGQDTIEIKTKYGLNIVEVKDNKIAIIDADCPDKICMKPGFIESVGENLVCLPHKLMVEVKGETSEDGVILSY